MYKKIRQQLLHFPTKIVEYHIIALRFSFCIRQLGRNALAGYVSFLATRGANLRRVALSAR